jgi:hypothetical protein
MAAIFLCLLGTFRSAFRRRSDLVLENLALRQQLAAFKHRHPRPRLSHDREAVFDDVIVEVLK